VGEFTSASALHGRYNSFKGIPFAQPPVGNLRFRAPQRHAGWTGTLNARDHGSFCPSRGLFGINEDSINEDCLFINVYSPSLSGSQAVMVYVHGGAFDLGSGDSLIYGPDFLVNEGTIVVTFNYRLGILGFLSTNDGAAQGNYAMKDMVMALEWVRDNIAYFGGNPNRVTLFGQSAGSVAVSCGRVISVINLTFIISLLSGSPVAAIANEPRRKLMSRSVIECLFKLLLLPFLITKAFPTRDPSKRNWTFTMGLPTRASRNCSKTCR